MSEPSNAVQVMASGDGRGPKYKIVNGFKFPKDFDKVEEALTYVAKPDDLFIVTYPKCGTTWTQQIVGSILRDGDMAEGKLFDTCPFLELRGKEAVEMTSNPKAIKTHLNYEMQPKHPTAKYIFVLRNPKDAAVSFYHHQLLFNYVAKDFTFSEFLPYFLRGEQMYGDYYDWVLSWWPHRNDENVLFLLYEDMKMDIRANVLKIAKFMRNGYETKLLANDGEVLNKVIERSSLKKMKMEVNQEQKRSFIESGSKFDDSDDCNFVRKGIVGDWKNHFTNSQNELFESHFHQRVDGSGIEHLWNDYNIFTN